MAGEVVRIIHDRRRVVAAVPVSRTVAERLEALIGGGCQLVDIRQADGHERLVLAPPASPQLLGKLRAAFPDAQLLVVELTDPDHDMRLGGPVTRALDAGADGYIVARSLEELAGQPTTGGTGVAAAAPAPAELPVATEERLMSLLDELLARRAESRAASDRE